MAPNFANSHSDSLRIATLISRYLPILKRLYILDTLAYAILQYFMVGTSQLYIYTQTTCIGQHWYHHYIKLYVPRIQKTKTAYINTFLKLADGDTFNAFTLCIVFLTRVLNMKLICTRIMHKGNHSLGLWTNKHSVNLAIIS